MAQQTLNQLKKQFEAGTSPAVSVFYSKAYPLIFFNILKKQLSASFFNLELNGLDQLKSALSMSFLGSKSTIIVNLSSLTAAKQKGYIEYINKYKGPNSLICFVDNSESFSKCIDLDAIAKRDINSIFTFLDLPRQVGLVSSLSDKLSLDEQTVLHYYYLCLGKHKTDFEAQWLNRIVKPEGSLFDLSSHFFARNRAKFFKSWENLEGTNSDMFWVSFWSEQLFRAFYYVKLRKANDLMGAKKISYRLPFSFIQKDWRFADLKAVDQAHKDIYNLDYGLKNGASSCSLDLFFANYFMPIK